MAELYLKRIGKTQAEIFTSGYEDIAERLSTIPQGNSRDDEWGYQYQVQGLTWEQV